VQVLEGNLRRVIGSQAPGGELRALSRQAMRSYARYWLEAFRLPVMPAGRLIGGVRTVFAERDFQRVRELGTEHQGNYPRRIAT
jgi:KDO2-lipid IV(A) lauroyltransferase